MRRVGVALGLVLVALAGVNVAMDLSRVAGRWSSYGPLADGEVPEFRAPMLAGGAFEPDDLRGKVSILSFWASWCGVCQSEMPKYEELHEERASDEVQVVLVNREGGGTPPARARGIVEQIVASRGLHMPVAIDDGRMYRAFRASVLPHTVVVDRDGNIRHVHPGRVMKSTLESEVNELLAEE